MNAPVQVVERSCKLTYKWQGTGNIGHLASRLAQDEVQGAPLEDRARKAGTAGPGGRRGAGGAGHSLWHLARKLVRLLVTHEVRGMSQGRSIDRTDPDTFNWHGTVVRIPHVS